MSASVLSFYSLYVYPLSVLRSNEYSVGHATEEFLSELRDIVGFINSLEVLMMRNNNLAAYRCGELGFYSSAVE